MTASEFAFLAIGLVLGVAAGAALVEVARSRPAARPEVRVTVAPNSIRTRATTLAEERHDGGPAAPARGGPADRRWVDREDDEDDPPADPPVSGSGSASGRQAPPAATPDSDGHASPNRTPVPFVLQPLAAGSSTSFPFPPLVAGGPPGGTGRAPVGIPITREPDPMMAALRMAAASRSAVREGDRSLAARNAAPSATRSTGGSATMTLAAGRGSTTGDEATHVGEAAPAGLAKRNGRGPKTANASGAASAADQAAAPDLGPCADQRRVADERCAVATRARDGARRAAEVLRQAQRDYDDHVGRAENAAASADPRSVRTAKESAQQAFRTARSAATSRDEIETAARDWLTEINRINQVTREAFTQAERHRAAAIELAPSLEPLALEADAARISAESAEEACVAAREAVAACEESVAAAATAAMERAGPQTVERDEKAEPDTGIAAAAPAANESSEFEGEESMGSRAGEDAAIIRMLRGDREVMPRIVARLAGSDSEEQRRWRTLLSDLVEALVARSIEAASFDFPTKHPFWGPFSRTQCRDIAAALASLGYRHDGFGDWADARVPSQRDLSLAVGYAGLDPMRIRQWPTEGEMRELLREVTVAADEYVWAAAGALTLGELVSLLGRRADGLTDLWNDWGAVRPLLLAVG